MKKATCLFVATMAFSLPVHAQDAGPELYEMNCAACHGAEREGMGEDFPSLQDVGDRLKPEEIDQVLQNGGEMMPPFAHLTEEERGALVTFLTEK